eukprot:4356546-Amphidinium_carterae.1
MMVVLLVPRSLYTPAFVLPSSSALVKSVMASSTMVESCRMHVMCYEIYVLRTLGSRIKGKPAIPECQAGCCNEEAEVFQHLLLVVSHPMVHHAPEHDSQN